ncbi:MAG TPA: hypothetical protein ENL27_00355 [Candidatus Parcubacteria bacterium]|nr:hypothetical protein [Candidatus Parcubacteria bacterium]
MLSCTISSLKKTVQYYHVNSVVLPAVRGQMQILPGHAETFVLLKKGTIVIEKEDAGGKEQLEIKEGQCYIKDNHLLIIL